MLGQYAFPVIFAIVAIGFVASGLLLVKIFAPSNPYPEKMSTYECGAETIGTAWVQYNVRYYMFTLIFLIFDVETVFIFPWTKVYRSLESFGIPIYYGFIEGFVFLMILFLGYIYAWRKGILEWV
ncbi:MAG: NADH-quinone oxidoreductase subunit A [Candidatus Riflebacteria bacterium]|nr:NADH-quinone oxidoreductase subunit A [Candidatus Riflebacteria bacterium]